MYDGAVAIASEFDQAARRLDEWAQDLVDGAGEVETEAANGGVHGPGVVLRRNRIVDAVTLNASLAAQSLQAVAEVCRDRADLCREYTEAMADYRRYLAAYQALPAEQQLGRYIYDPMSVFDDPVGPVSLDVTSEPDSSWALALGGAERASYLPVEPPRPGPWADEG